MGRERRERVIAAASARFAADGYDRTVLDQVAQDAEISLGALQHYFPSRRHLLAAVAENRLDVATADWESRGPTADVHEIFERMQAATVAFLRQPGMIELAVRVSADAIDPASPAHDVITARYRRISSRIEDDFTRSRDAGQLRADMEPAFVARLCLAVGDGLQLQWALSAQSIDLATLSGKGLAAVARAVIPSSTIDEARLAALGGEA